MRYFKKGLSLLLCLALLLCALSACTVQRAYEGAPENMRPINDGSEGGILYVPIAWSVDTSTGVPTAYVSSNNRTMITLVTVSADKLTGSIPEYFNSYRDSFSQSVKDFKIVKDSDESPDYTTRMIDTAGAYIYEYTGKVTNIEYKFKQAFFQHPDTRDLFIITYSASASSYDSYLSVLTEAYDNFKFVTEPIPMTDKTEVTLPDTDGVDVPEGYTLISNKFVDYYFFIPSTWTPSVNTGMSAAVASADERVSANVVAFSTDHTSLDGYWEGYEADLKATFGDIVYTSEAKYTDGTLGGLASRVYSYKITQGGTEYLYEQHAVIYGGYVYMLTFCCESSLYGTYSADLSGMLSNFRFKSE